MRRAPLAAAFMLVGCFSSHRPEAVDPTNPEDNPNATTVTGLVRRRISTGHFEPAPAWGVEVVWFAEGNRKLRSELARTGGDAVYKSVIVDPAVRSVRTRAVRCRYDPEGDIAVCCLDLFNPCPDGCPNPWENARTAQVHANGGRVQLDLNTNCEP